MLGVLKPEARNPMIWRSSSLNSIPAYRSAAFQSAPVITLAPPRLYPVRYPDISISGFSIKYSAAPEAHSEREQKLVGGARAANVAAGKRYSRRELRVNLMCLRALSWGNAGLQRPPALC
jgi:hypothetical protein